MPDTDDTVPVIRLVSNNGSVKFDIPDGYKAGQPAKIYLNDRLLGDISMVHKITSVKITAPEKDAKITAAGTAAAKVLDQGGDEITGETVTWKSSDTAKLTIDTDTGTYTPKATGTVTITAASKSKPEKTAAVNVTVEKQGG